MRVSRQSNAAPDGEITLIQLRLGSKLPSLRILPPSRGKELAHHSCAFPLSYTLPVRHPLLFSFQTGQVMQPQRTAHPEPHLHPHILCHAPPTKKGDKPGLCEVKRVFLAEKRDFTRLLPPTTRYGIHADYPLMPPSPARRSLPYNVRKDFHGPLLFHKNK